MSIGFTGPLTVTCLGNYTNRLQAWLNVVKTGYDLNRISLRRWPVDNGYPIRGCSTK